MKQAINFASGILTGAIVTALVAYFSGGQYRTLFILGFALPILIAVMYPRAIASFLLKIASAKEAFGGTTVTKSVNAKPGKPVAVPPVLSQDETDAVSALVNLGCIPAKAEKAVIATRGRAKGVMAIVQMASRRAA